MPRAGDQANFRVNDHNLISHATRLSQMSAAFFLKDMELEGFHRASGEFVFPLQIGIPGRVWKHRNFAWHGNIIHATKNNIAHEDFILDMSLSPSSMSSGLIVV